VRSGPALDRRRGSEGAGRPARRPQDGRAAGSALGDDHGKTFTPAEQSAREALFEERDRLRGATHYEVLAVDPKATPEEIKSAYVQAARSSHTDGFAGLDLGSARAVAEELFSG